jgi:hypothetical protein
MTQFNGDEECFADIRHFIMKESNVDECRRFITYGEGPLARELETGYRLSNWGHVLAVELDYLNLRAKVQLFAGPEANPFVYTVQLGRNPSIIDYNEAYGNFFVYYPKEERGEFDGEVMDLVGVRRG